MKFNFLNGGDFIVWIMIYRNVNGESKFFLGNGFMVLLFGDVVEVVF